MSLKGYRSFIDTKELDLEYLASATTLQTTHRGPQRHGSLDARNGPSKTNSLHDLLNS
jgi:hypothetical protein